MPKITLPRASGGYLTDEMFNSLAQALEDFSELVVMRDGEVPNAMEAPLDMNSQRILNLPPAVNAGDPVTKEDLDAAGAGLVIQRRERQTGSGGQTVFNFLTIKYTPGSNNLAVYKDGIRKFAGVDYTETDEDTVTFTPSLGAGQYDFIVNEFLGTVILPALPTVPWSNLTGIPETASRDPRWDEVTDKPVSFQPEPHTHDASRIVSGRLVDARRGVYVQASQPSSPETGDLWFF